MRKIFVLTLTMLLLLVGIVSASGVITDRLNFYDSAQHTITITNTIGGSGDANATAFELNYLHKIYNVKQYFNLASSSATDVSFSCVYPYHTVVREHLVTSISDDGSDWTVSYEIPRIDGSWERMGFLGMDFDDGEYNVGDTFTINCTDLSYNLEDAYGSIVVSEDSFSMEVRNPNPLSVTAISGSAEIGNGTSEVAITYVITNNEVYPLDSVQIEIESPEKATFIGVRGELWGTSRDKYLYELTEMEAGQVETITLIARFDTSTGSDTTLLLTEGVKAKFVPTWELNAYNPMTYIQDIAVATTQTVNYATTSVITSIQDQLDQIELNTITINNTINGFNSLLLSINQTTTQTSLDLLSINSTLSTQIANGFTNLSIEMDNLEVDIASLTLQVTNFENTVQQLVNCTANPSAPLCAKIDALNLSITNIQNDLTSINSSLSAQLTQIEGDIASVNQTIMSELSTQFTNVANNFTYTNNLILSINQSINDNIDGLNFTGLQNSVNSLVTTINNINTTTTNMYVDLLSINTTINNQLSTFNSKFQEILDELEYMQGFNEELIFLVTDSVGLAKESQTAYGNGDTDLATEKLEEATAKLVKAQEYIEDQKAKTQNELDQKTHKGFKRMIFWVKGLFI
jgi:predicted  nucleic acid-binding Zn-ribbon protein